MLPKKPGTRHQAVPSYSRATSLPSLLLLIYYILGFPISSSPLLVSCYRGSSLREFLSSLSNTQSISISPNVLSSRHPLLPTFFYSSTQTVGLSNSPVFSILLSLRFLSYRCPIVCFSFSSDVGLIAFFSLVYRHYWHPVVFLYFSSLH